MEFMGEALATAIWQLFMRNRMNRGKSTDFQLAALGRIFSRLCSIMALTADAKTATGGGGGDRSRFEFSIRTIKPTLLDTEPKEKNAKDSRADGRNTSQFRPTFLRTGTVTQANGSAYIEQGSTKVIASVYGPRPIVKATGVEASGTAPAQSSGGGPGAATSAGTSVGNDFSDQAIVTCDWKFSTFANALEEHTNWEGTQDRDLGMLVAQTLELAILRKAYPKSTIDINILILQDDGACLTTAITCAGLALAHAGIQLYDLIPACTISLSDTNQLYIDPTKQEERTQTGQLQLALLNGTQQVVLLKQNGTFTSEQTLGAISLATQGCQHTHSLLRKQLLSSVSTSS